MPRTMKKKKKKRSAKRGVSLSKSLVEGAIFKDMKLGRFIRVDSVTNGVAMVGCRRSTTGRFTEIKEPVGVKTIRRPRYKLWKAASEK